MSGKKRRKARPFTDWGLLQSGGRVAEARRIALSGYCDSLRPDGSGVRCQRHGGHHGSHWAYLQGRW